MPEHSPKTTGNQKTTGEYTTDEARLLAKISDQLADLQQLAHKIDTVAGEFLPAARGLLARGRGRLAGRWTGLGG